MPCWRSESCGSRNATRRSCSVTTVSLSSPRMRIMPVHEKRSSIVFSSGSMVTWPLSSDSVVENARPAWTVALSRMRMSGKPYQVIVPVPFSLVALSGVHALTGVHNTRSAVSPFGQRHLVDVQPARRLGNDWSGFPNSVRAVIWSALVIRSRKSAFIGNELVGHTWLSKLKIMLVPTCFRADRMGVGS